MMGLAFAAAWLAAAAAPQVRPAMAPDWASPVAGDSALAALIAEARDHNPGLLARQAAVRAAHQRVRPAGALPDPTLNAGVMDLVLPGFAMNRSDFTERDLELMQEVPWPGTLGARTDVARAAEQVARGQAGTLARDVATAMAAAYYRLRYTVAALGILSRQGELLDAAAQLTTTRYAGGLAPQSDPLQAKLARARLESDEYALRAEYVAALAAVNALRGKPAGDSLSVQPLAPEALRSLLRPLPAPDSLVALAREIHPRVKASQAAVEQAARQIRVERLGARPDFSVTLRYGNRPTLTLSNGFNPPDFFSAFVGLRLPIWAGRKQHRLADAARADSAGAAAILEETELELGRAVTETTARVEAAARRLVLLVDGVVPAARGTVESVVRSYQVGRAEFLTLLAVEDARYRAELEAAAVAAEYQTQLVMLRELAGEESQP